jgi:hypothetical protein
MKRRLPGGGDYVPLRFTRERIEVRSDTAGIAQAPYGLWAAAASRQGQGWRLAVDWESIPGRAQGVQFDLPHLGVNRREGNDVYVDRCPTSGGEPTRRGTSDARDAWGISGARRFGEVCRLEGDDNETQW